MVLLAGFILLNPIRAAAANDESITLSPVGVRQSMQLGEIKRGTLTVLNDGDSAYDFMVYTAPYSVNNGSYKPDYTSVRRNTDAYKWVQFDKTRWHLAPGQRVEVPYTLKVPYDVAPGGHYGVMFAETQPAQGSGTQVLRKKRVGSILYITTPGRVTRIGSVQSIRIHRLQSTPPIKATMGVSNTGNTDYVMKKTFTVKNLLGKTKYSEQKEHAILPDTKRQLDMEWKNASWLGVYKVIVGATIEGKATAQQSWVVVAPMWFIVLLVALIAGGIYALVRKKTRR